jgi:hypothetical protein
VVHASAELWVKSWVGVGVSVGVGVGVGVGAGAGAGVGVGVLQCVYVCVGGSMRGGILELGVCV